MQRWKLKQKIFAIASRLPGGSGLYRFLTNQILHSQKHAPWKWCQWFREHILLCRRHAGIDPYSADFWVIDPGWTIAPLILLYLTTDGTIIATDHQNRLRRVYNTVSRETILDNLYTVGKEHRIAPEKLSWLRDLSGLASPQRISRETGIIRKAPFSPTAASANNKTFRPADNSLDIILSMGTLEHYTPEQLGSFIAIMHRSLKPGGAVSHIIDHRDHFWHADKSIIPWEHLKYSPEEWKKLAGNSFAYCNRLLQSDYLKLFREAGFQIVYTGSKPYPKHAAPVKREALHPDYQQVSEQDLHATVSHIIAIRN